MLFDIPFISDWRKIGEHRQLLTDCNTNHKNEGQIDYDLPGTHDVGTPRNNQLVKVDVDVGRRETMSGLEGRD